ncbi:MAG: hypothetical protein HY820_13635 [Acidobacteria bacterium]|nr:hypothetical protein [Acidobacteriota bacterium]
MTVAEEFQRLASQLRDEQPAYILAEMNDLLTKASGPEIEGVSAAPIADPYLANYVAAMVEQAAHLRGVRPPLWTSGVAPLARPVFATPWMSLRAHLLLESPVPFRRRNIFIDATIGDRV